MHSLLPETCLGNSNFANSSISFSPFSNCIKILFKINKIEQNNSKLGEYYKLLKLYDRASIINDII